MLDINDIKGVIPPIVTPVDVHENIDPGGLRRVIDHVISGGVHGIFILGSNGEFYGFDFENQKQAIKTTVEHVNGRIPVYAGASAITTKECIKLVRLAETECADAVTVLAPMYINPSETEMYDHFVSIARSTKLPVLLYNNPGKTTNNISIGLLIPFRARPRRHNLSQRSMLLRSSDTTSRSRSLSSLAVPEAWEP